MSLRCVTLFEHRSNIEKGDGIGAGFLQTLLASKDKDYHRVADIYSPLWRFDAKPHYDRESELVWALRRLAFEPHHSDRSSTWVFRFLGNAPFVP